MLKVKRNIKLCKIENCTNNVQNNGLCCKHGAEKRYCKVENCKNMERKNNLCIKHGAITPKCTINECNNKRIKNGLCFQHGAEKCKIEDCKNNSTDNSSFCLSHGGEYKKCKVPNCNKCRHSSAYCSKHNPNYIVPFNLSKGEAIIKKILEEKGIEFEDQKSFKDCKNKSKLQFDFYLQKYNLIIEYDGYQHFNPYQYWKCGVDFLYRRLNDEIKNNYCLKNKINLLRIPYNVKNVNEIQSTILNAIETIKETPEKHYYKFINENLYENLNELNYLNSQC